MIKFTGYDEDNTILNMLEELKWTSRNRANDLMSSDNARQVSEAYSNAYAFAQYLIMNKEKFNG